MASFQFPIASGKKKPVKVFECPVESWKERAPRPARKGDRDAEPELTLKQQIRKELDDAFDSVKEFASAGLKGKEKKAHEAKKIEALGGKAAKARVTPYNILIGLKKKGAVREKRQKEENREAGVVTGKRKPSSSSSSKVTSKSRKKVDYGVQATKGKFKNGVLTVSRTM
ncbi:hypothetical protein PybrP1_001121 [[Pythium] brassicae (nom. inval.)]|nr:hypothetical protein PybrP1_001121 [[Pythium] brassicae (nom. inval.)]